MELVHKFYLHHSPREVVDIYPAVIGREYEVFISTNHSRVDVDQYRLISQQGERRSILIDIVHTFMHFVISVLATWCTDQYRSILIDIVHTFMLFVISVLATWCTGHPSSNTMYTVVRSGSHMAAMESARHPKPSREMTPCNPSQAPR